MGNGITVDRWISRKEARGKPESVGGLGGWVDGHPWDEYVERFAEADWPYMEALRRDIVERGLRMTGEDHQNDDEGTPLFSDGTIASFSWRAWGDLMASIWNTEENTDIYCYMSFYMRASMAPGATVHGMGERRVSLTSPRAPGQS